MFSLLYTTTVHTIQANLEDNSTLYILLSTLGALNSTLFATTAVWTTNISSTHHTGVEIIQVVGKAQGSILAGGDLTTPKSDSQEYDHG